MDGRRIIPCSACSGDGCHHDFGGYRFECAECGGTGEYEIELQEIDMEDLDAAMSPK